MNTAQIILSQLGGNRFVAMTGAKNLASSPDALHFKLPSNFARGGINSVKITLTPDDTYTVDYFKVRGVTVKSIAKSFGIFSDMLQKDFTNITGLNTSF
jgi:hypothetical protein